MEHEAEEVEVWVDYNKQIVELGFVDLNGNKMWATVTAEFLQDLVDQLK